MNLLSATLISGGGGYLSTVNAPVSPNLFPPFLLLWLFFFALPLA